MNALDDFPASDVVSPMKMFMQVPLAFELVATQTTGVGGVGHVDILKVLLQIAGRTV